MRGEGREERGGEGRREEAFLVMWPTKLSALNPLLCAGEVDVCHVVYR